jgi:hypothetical protein
MRWAASDNGRGAGGHFDGRATSVAPSDECLSKRPHIIDQDDLARFCKFDELTRYRSLDVVVAVSDPNGDGKEL